MIDKCFDGFHGSGFLGTNEPRCGCQFNGVNLVRLNEDGSPDPTFDTAGYINDVVCALAIQPDGQIVIGGNFDNVAANRIRASAHCFEAKVFGIVTAGYMDQPMRAFLIERDRTVADVIDQTPRAASFFVDPTGRVFGDELQDQEGIAYAEIDLNRCVEPKQFHDVVGYYNRFDIFGMTVDRSRLTPARFSDEEQPTTKALDGAILSVDADAVSNGQRREYRS